MNCSPFALTLIRAELAFSIFPASPRVAAETRRFSGTLQFDLNAALRVRGESNTLKGSSLASSGRFATVARPIHAASTTSRLR